MGDFGENLRRQREALGVDLEAISAVTKISVRLLQAIEGEQFERLPGGVFNLNFVRQYARHLRLDEEKIIAGYRQATAPPPVDPQAPPPRAAPSTQWPVLSAVRQQRWLRLWVPVGLLVLALVLALAGGWRRWRAAQVTAVALPKAASPVPPAPAPLAQAQPAEAAPRAEVGAAPVNLEIRATQAVWVSAAADGQIRLRETMKPNQSQLVTAEKQIWLWIGDAASVVLTLNGKPQPAIGEKGHVKRVVCTREGIRILAPAAGAESSSTPPADGRASPNL